MARPPWFAPGTQQDCSEFLKFLLDRVSEEDKTLNDDSDNDSTTKTSIVDDTFAGKLLVCLCCRSCGNTSCREEVFTDLPLAFPQAGELEGRVDQVDKENLLSTKQPVEHANVTASESSKVTSERNLKGGDITHTTSAPNLETKPGEDIEAVAASSAHGSTSADSSRSFNTGENLSSKLRDSGLRADAPDISITELLEYFFEPEILEGPNQYHCERCNSLQDAERTVTIAKTSAFLVLTLKRFAYNVRTQQRSKILQSVSCPLTFSLPSAHLRRRADTRRSEDVMETEEILEEKTEDIMNQSCFRSKRTRQEYDGVTNSACTDIVSSSCDEKPASDMVYSLCSVIVHSGTSSESGHYYCYARSCAHLVGGEGSDDGASSRTTDQDTWFLFNDSRVSYSAYSSFSDVSKRFPKDTPYVLIYKRISSFGTVTPVSTDAQAGEIKPELADLVNRDNLLYLKVRDRSFFMEWGWRGGWLDLGECHLQIV